MCIRDRVEELLVDLDRERLNEKDAAAADEIGRRVDDYGAQLAEMKTAAAGELDAAEWTELDLALQDLSASLRTIVGESRLKALLDRI